MVLSIVQVSISASVVISSGSVLVSSGSIVFPSRSVFPSGPVFVSSGPVVFSSGSVVVPSGSSSSALGSSSLPSISALELVLHIGDVGFLFFVGVDSDILLESDSSEEVDLKGNVILNETFESIADSEDVALRDEFGVVALEESFGRAGVVGHNAVDHGDLEALFGLNGLGLGGNDLDVDVESGSMSLQVFYFDKSGFVERFVLSHMLRLKINQVIK